MKQIYILFILIFFIGCAGTKVINGREQTFTEYVIINKYAVEGLVPKTGDTMADWRGMDSDCFPGIRLIKWMESEEN